MSYCDSCPNREDCVSDCGYEENGATESDMDADYLEGSLMDRDRSDD
jgi:hypothetical protein